MSSPREKTKPVKTIPFKQSNLIFFNRLFGGSNLNRQGVCLALVKTWYEMLLDNKSLIEEIGTGLLTNKMLVSKIAKWQKYPSVCHHVKLDEEKTKNLNPSMDENGKRKLLKAPWEYSLDDDPLDEAEKNVPKFESFKDSLDKEKAYKKLFGEDWQDQARKITYNESFLSDLDFSEGIETPISSKNLLEHLNLLEQQDRNQHGLHLIGIVDSKTFNSGHQIGWTFKNNQYILFDPNVGEMYFNDFKQFKDFTCDYVQSIFPKWEKRMFNQADFYTSEDLTNIEENRRKQTRVKCQHPTDSKDLKLK